MMKTIETLAPPLRQLIDMRLDAIERVLLSTEISRSERREIVQSVEDQIYELLSRRDESPTREGVLAVFAQIDPPEAYLDCRDGNQTDRSFQGRRDSAGNSSQAKAKITPLAIVSCVLGVLSLISFVIWPVSAAVGIAATVCGTIALTQIYYTQQLRGVWLSIIGICSPAVALATLLVLVNL